MAAAGESGSSITEEVCRVFYVEKRDSVLTSKNQIDRLTRPGSTYFNVNPFEVLQVDPYVGKEEVKKKFRQLGVLVHPDKNQDDAERAQQAFEAVYKAYKLLLDPDQRKWALNIMLAGREFVRDTMEERKWQLKKEGKPTIVAEDDPVLFKQEVYKQTLSLFADLDIKRREREDKELYEMKRQWEEEIKAYEEAEQEREWPKNSEGSQNDQVESWRIFQVNKREEREENPSLPNVKKEQSE